MRKGSANKDVAGGQTSPEKEDDHCTCSDANGSEVVDYVCRNCQQLICKYCKSATHGNHKSQTVETVAREIRNNITKCIPAPKKEEKMTSIHKAKQIIADMKKELIVLETQEVHKIDQQLNELKVKLDEIRTELVEKVTDVVRRDLDNLNKAERDLNKTAANITKMCDAADQMIAEANDIDVVRRGYSFCDELNEMFKTEISSPTKGQAFNVKFIVAATDLTRLIDLVGKAEFEVKEGISSQQQGISSQQQGISSQQQGISSQQQARSYHSGISPQARSYPSGISPQARSYPSGISPQARSYPSRRGFPMSENW